MPFDYDITITGLGLDIKAKGGNKWGVKVNGLWLTLAKQFKPKDAAERLAVLYMIVIAALAAGTYRWLQVIG